MDSKGMDSWTDFCGKNNVSNLWTGQTKKKKKKETKVPMLIL